MGLFSPKNKINIDTIRLLGISAKESIYWLAQKVAWLLLSLSA